MAISSGRYNVARELARQTVLYGTPDGRNMDSVLEVSRYSGCPASIVKMGIDDWLEEREKLYREASPLAASIRVSDDVVGQFTNDVKWLRGQMDRVIGEERQLEAYTEKLARVVEEVAANIEPEKAQAAFEMLGSYISSMKARKTLVEQFVAMQKTWVDLAGLRTMLDARSLYEKELAKRAAQKAIAADEGSGNCRDATPGGGVFEIE